MLITFHAFIAILLSISIVLQHRASGLSATFGGSGSSYVQRRGAESLIYRSSVGLAILFFGLGVLQLFV